MDSATVVRVALAILSGFSFALMALAYLLAPPRGVRPQDIAAYVGIGGTLAFAVRSLRLLDGAAGWGAVPTSVWVLGLAAGITQGLAICLMAPAQRRGPFSPVYASYNLMFVPAAVYAVWVLREAVGAGQWMGVAAAAVCVFAAGFAADAGPSIPVANPRPASARQRLEYLGLIIGILVLCGLSGVALKELGAARPGQEASRLALYGDVYFLALYAGFSAVSLWPLLRLGQGAWRLPMVGLGVLAAAGSVMGFYLVMPAMVLPGGAGIAISSVCAIVGAAVMGTLWFGERRTPAWYISIGAAVAAVALFNLKA